MKSVTLLRQRRLTRDLEANTEPERPELPTRYSRSSLFLVLLLSNKTSRTVDSEDEGVTSLTATNASSEARVKITLWRVVNTIFILGVGIAKAILAYQGYSTSPNTLDWIIGVLWASLYVNQFFSTAIRSHTFWLAAHTGSLSWRPNAQIRSGRFFKLAHIYPP